MMYFRGVKRVLLLSIFMFALGHCTVFAQVISKPKAVSNALSLSLPQFNVTSSGIGLKLGGFKLGDSKSLLIYNRHTGTNDIFSPVKQEDKSWRYERRASVLLLENQLRGNKIDSFNPYGSDSIGQGILAGALNLLFQ